MGSIVQNPDIPGSSRKPEQALSAEHRGRMLSTPVPPERSPAQPRQDGEQRPASDSLMEEEE